jgi:GNAT superfamily N-acetyltransferase
MRDARVGFSPYDVAYRDRCVAVFDANCPEFFAPNERVEYVAFLDRSPAGYEVCLVDGEVAGAFGLIVAGESADGATDLRLHWILIDPAMQGRGVGTSIMRRVVRRARESTAAAGPPSVQIAASDRSAPFFARFGAVEVRRTPDGWGPGMHRVDMVLAVAREPVS